MLQSHRTAVRAPLAVPLCRSLLLLRALTGLRTSAGWKKDFQMLLETPDPARMREAAPAAAPRALFMTACLQVRKTPSRPRSWANFSLLYLYSHRNAWANLRRLGQPNTSLAAA